MRTFLLFWFLAWLTGNPFLAGLIILLIFGGSYFLYSRRLYRFRQLWRERAAARQLRALLAINPEDAKARSDLGGLLARRGRFAEALPHLEKAIARSEDIPDTNFFLGWTYLELGDLEKGRRYIQRALGFNPRFGYGQPHLRLGDYFVRREDYKEAIPHYEAFREIHGSGIEGVCKLAECYLAIGEREKAVATLRDGLEAYRGLPWYRKQEERGWARRARAAFRRAGRGDHRPERR